MGELIFRPDNPPRPLKPGQVRQVATVIARNPVSVVCEESIFVNAVTTLGVPEVSYQEIRREMPGGGSERLLVWRLETKSVDGSYRLSQLIKWWNDPEWLAKNPSHELAIAKVVSENLMRMAKRVREQPYLMRLEQVCENGTVAVHIPSNATEEERTKWLAELG